MPGEGDGGDPSGSRGAVLELDSAGIEAAAAAIRDGTLVVYPTETVYGLGADAQNPAAVERVFDAKGRPRSKPVSMALPSVDAALEYVVASDREARFMREFLPGAVTVLLERGDRVPDALTAGRDVVGVRVPDHDGALALLEAADGPVTATSANVSGRPSARRVADLDDRVREAAAVVLDGGETPGDGSTVVDVATSELHRRGPLAAEVETWLATGGG
jgi:L-threonylcarbamoyladenylate synthase